MEETVQSGNLRDDKKNKKGKKMIENPTNKFINKQVINIIKLDLI